MTKLRIAFMGTPDFAVPGLRALKDAGHDIVAVYSQPPKPAGRGQQIQKSPMHRAGEEMGIPVHTPKSLRNAEEQKIFTDLKLDIAVVAAYGLILPKAILDAPKFGCLNIHASLLPRWRGAAPIQRAILAGDSQSGVTIMQMDEGLDTGAMLLADKVAITDKTTAGSLHDDLMAMGSKLIIKAVEGRANGTLKATPQPEAGVTYAAKLTREDGRIDWSKSASEIERQIRGLQPWPGCFFMLGNEAIKVQGAEIADKSGTPGTLLADDFTVACGEKSLRLTSVQRAGKNATDGASFLRGQRISIGQKL
ncbi:MAG TPA: methionyl-tRNA formyltransferase [Alphaproteobacteria bacterium]|nr:methionyl-tRNA formyltransferase [Alphaproteobacteria bacterium]